MVMAEATNHYFKHLGVSDGLSQVCIPSIYQDELGAVWLGTTEGLNRYNGKDVKVFQPSESNHGLTNNEINELCGDKNGRMYIRSGNDLIKLDIYTEQFTCLRQKGVYGLFCKKDTLWVSCADGIYYYTGQGTELTFFARVQKGFVGRALYVDKETVWVVTRKYLVAISREDPLRQEILLTLDKGNCIPEIYGWELGTACTVFLPIGRQPLMLVIREWVNYPIIRSDACWKMILSIFG